jgi:signal transduction histidine kinase
MADGADNTTRTFPWGEVLADLPLAMAVFDAEARVIAATPAWLALADWPGPGSRADDSPRTAALAGRLRALAAGHEAGCRHANLNGDGFDLDAAPVTIGGQGAAAVTLYPAERTNAHLAFLRALAHDVGSPLQTVAGFSELLRQRPDHAFTENDRRYVAMIADASRQAVDLLQGSLALAQALFVDAPAVPEPVRLAETMVDAVAAITNAADAAGVVLSADTNGCAAVAMADADGLKRALIAVLARAINVSPKDACVGVVLEKAEDDRFAYRVSDAGAATSPAAAARFDHSILGDGVPRGLELALARALLRRQGGELSVAGNADGGTVVRLFLPVDGQTA